jgi:hypothetical protein
VYESDPALAAANGAGDEEAGPAARAYQGKIFTKFRIFLDFSPFASLILTHLSFLM